MNNNFDTEWATPSLKEAPFWHDSMTPEEYDTERDYLNNHIEDYWNGSYMPLWKQKQ